MMERRMFIDKTFPLGGEVIRLATREDVSKLMEDYFLLKHPPVVNLNVWGMRGAGYNFLLKFLEEYRGGVNLLIREAVPGVILSRFIEVEKEVNVEEGSFMDVVVLSSSRESQREKLKILFRIKDRGD